MNDSSQGPLAPGVMVGPYRIASVLQADSGIVLEAFDPVSQRRVLIRSLPVESNVVDKLSLATGLRHPNLVPLLGIEQGGSCPCAVWEFAKGKSLSDDLLQLGRLPWREAASAMADACRGLDALHHAGLIHGDIKPSCLVRSVDGPVRLADYSIGGRPAVHFTAPERLSGLPADVLTDIYSLGATFFQLLSGQPPFHDATSPAEIAHAHNHRPVPSVRTGLVDLPLRCDSILQRAMAKNPGNRYPSAAAMLADLEALAKTDVDAAPLPAIPPIYRVEKKWSRWGRRLAVSIVPVLLLVGLAWLPSRNRQAKPERAADKEKPASLPTFVNSIGMTLVRIPAGEFIMGDPLRADARPHPVRLTRGFWIGVYEVTQRQFATVMGENPSEFRGDAYPVENVSWADAVAFCEKLSRVTDEERAGRVYRLPTEAEWEYCCRAGSKSPFFMGRTLPAQSANALTSGLRRTVAVGTYPSNAWGIFDMHGNVGEWCSDWYGMDYYTSNSGINPTGPDSGGTRVVRGGGFLSPPDECHSGYRREDVEPGTKSRSIGFRIVATTASDRALPSP